MCKGLQLARNIGFKQVVPQSDAKNLVDMLMRPSTVKGCSLSHVQVLKVRWCYISVSGIKRVTIPNKFGGDAYGDHTILSLHE